MCLAVPAKIIELHDNKAVVDFDGCRREVSTYFLDKVSEGDYVLLHAGIALQCIDPIEAREILRLFDALKAPG